MTFVESVDMLRGRFVRCKGSRTLTSIACELHVDLRALSGFLKGTRGKVALLEAVERWCDAQERQRADRESS